MPIIPDRHLLIRMGFFSIVYDQDFLRSSLVGNENNVLQSAPLASHLDAPIGTQGGIDLMVVGYDIHVLSRISNLDFFFSV